MTATEPKKGIRVTQNGLRSLKTLIDADRRNAPQLSDPKALEYIKNLYEVIDWQYELLQDIAEPDKTQSEPLYITLRDFVKSKECKGGDAIQAIDRIEKRLLRLGLLPFKPGRKAGKGQSPIRALWLVDNLELCWQESRE